VRVLHNEVAEAPYDIGVHCCALVVFVFKKVHTRRYARRITRAFTLLRAFVMLLPDMFEKMLDRATDADYARTYIGQELVRMRAVRKMSLWDIDVKSQHSRDITALLHVAHSILLSL